MNDRRDKRLRFTVPVGLFLLALAVRALPWVTVFTPKGVQFVGMDAYYHMRRILNFVVHFPDVVGFDRYINFPDGARPIWTFVFDWAIACLARPFCGEGNYELVERLAAWIPPILGAACVVVTYGLAKRFFGIRTAVVAGLFLSILPAHFWYSQVGFVDHHVAVALVSTLLLSASMRMILLFAPEATDARQRLFWTGATGVLSALALLLWPGCLLHVALVETAFWGCTLTRANRSNSLLIATHLAWTHAVAFLIVLPFGLAASWPQWSDYSPAVLSRFQPWLFGWLTVCYATCAGFWRWSGYGKTFRLRAITAVSTLLVTTMATMVLFSGIMQGGRDAWEWFAKKETFQAMVSESRPLFEVDGKAGVGVAHMMLSLCIYLYPVGFILLLRGMRRSARGPAVGLFLVWSLGLCLATLVQRRFYNSFAPIFCVLIAWTFVLFYERFSLLWRSPSSGRIATIAGMAAVAIFLLYPTVPVYESPLRNLALAARGRPAGYLTSSVAKVCELVEAAEWIRNNTPKTSGFFSSGAKPEYGVLCWWGYGHVLEYKGRRATVADNFGDDIGKLNFGRHLDYVGAGSETEGAAILERLGVRYILVNPIHPVQLAELGLAGKQTLFGRLFYTDGDGLARHRLLYEVRRLGSPPRAAKAAFKVFELVKGAVVSGRARAGSRVTATLPYRTNLGRTVIYGATAVADSSRTYTLRLPYANRGAGRSALKINPAYVLAAAGRQKRLVLDESQVLEGMRVAGPDFTR